MYPECRHIHPAGGTCNSPAVKGSHWCYFHARLHQRQTARHRHRLPDGRFAPLSAARSDPRPTDTLDYGTYPVEATQASQTGQSEAPAVPLDLPPIEDAASIQLALIDVLQALAANQLDPKRAGLLLYGLQVASANAKNIHLPLGSVRSVTHTEDGTPLAPQDYGYDIEDYEAEEDEENDKEE